jgi:hypothetical protein
VSDGPESGGPWPLQDRRNDHDVTNTVRVSSPADVRRAVEDLFQETCPRAAFDVVWMAFHDFERLFDGQMETYAGCDTVYHDRQHTLDVALAMARLLAGYERSCRESDRLGERRIALGLILALFHDAGYIRRTDERRRRNGAEFTLWHVTRSAEFLRGYLPRLGLGELAELGAQLVHFTGYERNLEYIELDDPRDTIVGHLVGTADLMAQVADRCYLEKCRDRLYSEFVLSGVAISGRRGEQSAVRYASGIDLLQQTPGFWVNSVAERLDRKFNRAYRYVEPLFGGRNPYMASIRRNLEYLDHVIDAQDWRMLRRQPPCFTVLSEPMRAVSALVSRYLAERDAPAAALTLP